MSKVLTILMLIVTVVAGGIIFLLVRERGTMFDRLVQSGVTQKLLESEVQSLQQERDRLLRRIQNPVVAAPAEAPADPKPAVPASKVAATPAQPASANANSGAQGRKMLAEMMKNPAMKEMMKQQQLAMLDTQYASLFSMFQFDDGEKADFKKLLGERMTLDTELGFKMMGEDVTKEQRDAMLKDYQENKKASDASIHKFLNNDDDFAAYQRWDNTKSERFQLDMGRSLFTGSGEALSPEQEQQLVDAMYQARTALGNGKDISKPENFDPASLNEEGINTQLSHFDDNARQVYQAATQFLTPKQLETLRTLQQQWRTMSETGLRMSASMFQTPKGK